MPRRPIVAGIEAGASPARDEEEAALRDALARWATGVAVLALREEGVPRAMTMTAFMPLSLRPPLIAAAIGVHAPLATLLEPGADFALSILAEDQRRWANVFADAFVADRSALPPAGDPALVGALSWLSCRVDSVQPAGDHLLVVAEVRSAGTGDPLRPLLYYDREYRSLEQEA